MKLLHLNAARDNFIKRERKQGKDVLQNAIMNTVQKMKLKSGSDDLLSLEQSTPFGKQLFTDTSNTLSVKLRVSPVSRKESERSLFKRYTAAARGKSGIPIAAKATGIPSKVGGTYNRTNAAHFRRRQSNSINQMLNDVSNVTATPIKMSTQSTERLIETMKKSAMKGSHIPVKKELCHTSRNSKGIREIFSDHFEENIDPSLQKAAVSLLSPTPAIERSSRPVRLLDLHEEDGHPSCGETLDTSRTVPSAPISSMTTIGSTARSSARKRLALTASKTSSATASSTLLLAAQISGIAATVQENGRAQHRNLTSTAHPIPSSSDKRRSQGYCSRSASKRAKSPNRNVASAARTARYLQGTASSRRKSGRPSIEIPPEDAIQKRLFEAIAESEKDRNDPIQQENKIVQDAGTVEGERTQCIRTVAGLLDAAVTACESVPIPTPSTPRRCMPPSQTTVTVVPCDPSSSVDLPTDVEEVMSAVGKGSKTKPNKKILTDSIAFTTGSVTMSATKMAALLSSMKKNNRFNKSQGQQRNESEPEQSNDSDEQSSNSPVSALVASSCTPERSVPSTEQALVEHVDDVDGANTGGEDNEPGPLCTSAQRTPRQTATPQRALLSGAKRIPNNTPIQFDADNKSPRSGAYQTPLEYPCVGEHEWQAGIDFIDSLAAPVTPMTNKMHPSALRKVVQPAALPATPAQPESSCKSRITASTQSGFFLSPKERALTSKTKSAARNKRCDRFDDLRLQRSETLPVGKVTAPPQTIKPKNIDRIDATTTPARRLTRSATKSLKSETPKSSSTKNLGMKPIAHKTLKKEEENENCPPRNGSAMTPMKQETNCHYNLRSSNKKESAPSAAKRKTIASKNTDIDALLTSCDELLGMIDSTVRAK